MDLSLSPTPGSAPVVSSPPPGSPTAAGPPGVPPPTDGNSAERSAHERRIRRRDPPRPAGPLRRPRSPLAPQTGPRAVEHQRDRGGLHLCCAAAVGVSDHDVTALLPTPRFIAVSWGSRVSKPTTTRGRSEERRVGKEWR